MDKDIFERIRSEFVNFTTAHKKIASFLMENYEKASGMSSYEMAKELNLSPATIVRFAMVLNYQGFPEMMKSVQASAFRIARGPMKKLRESIVKNEPLQEVLHKVVQHEMDCLAFEKFEQINDAFVRAAEFMIHAKRIFLIGARSSFGIAHYAAYMLGNASKNVFLLSSSAEDRYDRLDDISADDMVILVSYHRYYQDTLDMAQYAQGCNAFVLGITDSAFSPINPFCSEILVAPNPCPFTSYVSAMAIMDALILAFTQARAEHVHDILGHRMQVLMDHGVYAESDEG
ncbi:MAG: MurR/RpiR family transcriptional regulator [Synergistaceae bacterium]|nr:MurR/RpiR family transcriptional regulator [Synergistaceae bacterium]MBP9625876.1 MurR/RpiR family transcriptional regulator [Synergistaceae bacterium]MBP9957784.1 MurR/RpiR family transcriptional regulator [Synergistaceae bacterium]